MEEVDTGKTPSYSEITERFGYEVSIDEALEKTAAIQEQYPELTGIGSVLGSPQLYGLRDLRTTSNGLDFIGPPETIAEMDREADESWLYNGSYVCVLDGAGNQSWEREWLVAVIPSDTPAFEDEKHDEFVVPREEIEDAPVISTEQGEIKAVPPCIGYASKLRRYKMQRDNRGSFKQGDLIDIASMTLRELYDEGRVIEGDRLGEYVEQYLGELPDSDRLAHDVIESLEEEDSLEKLRTEEVHALLKDIREGEHCSF